MVVLSFFNLSSLLFLFFHGVMTDTEEEVVDLAVHRRRRAKQIKAAVFLLEDVKELVNSTNVDTINLQTLMDKGTELQVIIRRGNRSIDILRFQEEDEELHSRRQEGSFNA